LAGGIRGEPVWNAFLCQRGIPHSLAILLILFSVTLFLLDIFTLIQGMKYNFLYMSEKVGALRTEKRVCGILSRWRVFV
jgi:hypothetical protein